MNEMKKARVTTASELLKAGFVPAGNDLVNKKTGASVNQAVLRSLEGRVIDVEETGTEEFPAIHGGTILPAAAVALTKKKSKVKTQGGVEREITLFTDGAALLWDGSIVSPLEAAKLAGSVSPEAPAEA